MSKREAVTTDFQWESEEAEGEEASGELGGGSPAARPVFHLKAARKIEEARERRQLRQAIEDFDDYDV
jgi:hypothetical protein